MFSKSQIKLINSLSQKKYRHRHQLFIIEGKKGILELLESGLELHSLYTTQDNFGSDLQKTFVISEAELKKISNLTTPQTALALFHISETHAPVANDFQLVLDEVQDPGNLGTIIRLCDWFGVEDLICSKGTVDCYNPKVVQATMGSISRVNVVYTDISEYLEATASKMPIYGAFLEGENLYRQRLRPRGIVVLGNEANGISAKIEALVTNKLSIPQFGEFQKTESLNVATATAIFLSEFFRREITEK